MKKLALLLVVISTVMLAKLPEIKPQRLITDYNGVVYNGGNILCYGEYGIITYSEDLGKTWEQLSIGDKHNIKKMRTYNGNIYAVSNYAYLYSEDGLEWTIEEIDTEGNMVSFTIVDGNKYILSKNGLFEYNDNSKHKLFDLDISKNYSNFETDGTYLYFIEDSISLIKYDISKNTTDYIISDISESKDIMGNTIYNSLKQLKIVDNTIYVLCYDNNDVYSKKNILSSGDYGNNWEDKLQQRYNELYSFFIDNNNNKNDIYYIDYAYRFHSQIFDDYDGIDIKTSLTLNKITDTKNTELISSSEYIYKNEFLDYYISSNEDILNEVILIEEEIIVAVGQNKSIFISYDFGKSFECISNLRKYEFALTRIVYTGVPNYYYFSDSNIVVSNLHRSTNCGVTWLPKKFNRENVENTSSAFNGGRFLHTMKLETGEVIFTRYRADLLKLYSFSTNDFGENIDNMMNSDVRSDINSRYSLYGVELEDNILYTNHYRVNENRQTRILITGKDHEQKDEIIIDSVQLYQIFKLNNNELAAIGLQRAGFVMDEHGVNYRKHGPVYMQSYDGGYNWEISDLNIPTGLHLNSQYKYKDYLLMPNTHWSKYFNQVYYIDLKETRLDSFSLPSPVSNLNTRQNIFEYKNMLFYISNDFALYYTNDFDFDNTNWNKIDLSDYLYNWDSFDLTEPQLDKNVIYSAYADNEQLYLITGKSIETSGFMGTEISLVFNVVKLFDDDPNTSVEQTETQNYLYTYPPFPQPASTEVRSLVYWDTSLEMNTESVKIYNINGTEVSREQDISFEQINAYSGNLIWNCTNVPDGVYLIQISHGDKTQTIKVMVRK